MVVPMKKINLIFAASELEKNIVELQELGVVDIHYGNFDYDSIEGKNYLSVVNALEALKEVKNNSQEAILFNNDEDVHAGASPVEIAEEINGYKQEILTLEKHNDELAELYKESSLIGNISNKTIEELSQKHVHVSIFKTDKVLKTLPKQDNVVIEQLYTLKGKACYAVIRYKDAEFSTPISWHEYRLPDLSGSEIKETISINTKEIDEIKKLLIKKLDFEKTLINKSTKLYNVLSRKAVIDSGELHEEQLLVVEGFFPVPEYTKINAYANSKTWGVVISSPTDDDEVPTLTKSFRVVNIIKPLFKLMDTVPGYKEFDISAMFLLFITLFFSMIIGDAGYGTIMFVTTLLVTLKAIKLQKVSLTHYLLLWFSFTTIIWGAITGNWFGYTPFAEHPLLSKLVFDPIYSNNASSTETIMLFSFRVGLVHLLLAHIWRIGRLIRSSFWAVIHEIANIMLLFGLYFVVLYLILDPQKYPIPSFAMLAIQIGVVAIIITCEQTKGQNFFIGILKGLASLFNLFLGWIGNLAELISYIRLFAVGLASLVIAQTFNTMGLSIMAAEATPAVSIILLVIGAIVIGLGHALNLAMALLAVMVHGVRLNMLEFGMHLGMEWTGRNFSPFQNKKILTLEDK